MVREQQHTESAKKTSLEQSHSMIVKYEAASAELNEAKALLEKVCPPLLCEGGEGLGVGAAVEGLLHRVKEVRAASASTAGGSVAAPPSTFMGMAARWQQMGAASTTGSPAGERSLKRGREDSPPQAQRPAARPRTTTTTTTTTTPHDLPGEYKAILAELDETKALLAKAGREDFADVLPFGEELRVAGAVERLLAALQETLAQGHPGGMAPAPGPGLIIKPEFLGGAPVAGEAPPTAVGARRPPRTSRGHEKRSKKAGPGSGDETVSEDEEEEEEEKEEEEEEEWVRRPRPRARGDRGKGSGKAGGRRRGGGDPDSTESDDEEWVLSSDSEEEQDAAIRKLSALAKAGSSGRVKAKGARPRAKGARPRAKGAVARPRSKDASTNTGREYLAEPLRVAFVHWLAQERGVTEMVARDYDGHMERLLTQARLPATPLQDIAAAQAFLGDASARKAIEDTHLKTRNKRYKTAWKQWKDFVMGTNLLRAGGEPVERETLAMSKEFRAGFLEFLDTVRRVCRDTADRYVVRIDKMMHTVVLTQKPGVDMLRDKQGGLAFVREWGAYMKERMPGQHKDANTGWRHLNDFLNYDVTKALSSRARNPIMTKDFRLDFTAWLARKMSKGSSQNYVSGVDRMLSMELSTQCMATKADARAFIAAHGKKMKEYASTRHVIYQYGWSHFLDYVQDSQEVLPQMARPAPVSRRERRAMAKKTTEEGCIASYNSVTFWGGGGGDGGGGDGGEHTNHDEAGASSSSSIGQLPGEMESVPPMCTISSSSSSTAGQIQEVLEMHEV